MNYTYAGTKTTPRFLDQPHMAPSSHSGEPPIGIKDNELGYRPNLAARYLQSRKQLRIGVHLPRRIALFWDSLREGIREAAAPFAPALQVDFHAYPSLGEGDIPLFEAALREGASGLIIAPGNPSALAPSLENAA